MMQWKILNNWEIDILVEKEKGDSGSSANIHYTFVKYMITTGLTEMLTCLVMAT